MTLCSDSNKDDGWIYDQGKERQRDTKKRKLSLPKLFAWKGPSDSKDRIGNADREQQYQCLRANSFHSRGSQLPSNSPTHFSIGRVHTIETSTPTLPQFANRRPKPKLPQLAIPRPTSSRSQSKLMFPPTPKIMDTSTRATIKALGLSKNIPQAARPFPTNFLSMSSATSVLLCSMVGNDTASTAADSKCTPDSILASIHKPLPAIPTSESSSSPICSGDGIRSNQVNHCPQDDSLPSGVGGHPTRETVSSLGFRQGRRLPLPPIILPTYRPSGSMLSISPQLQNATYLQGRNTMHYHSPTSANPAMMPSGSLVVTDSATVISPTPAPSGEGTDDVVLRPKSRYNQRQSSECGSDMPHSGTSRLYYEVSLPRHQLSEPVRRVRGPRSPRLRGVESGPQLSVLRSPTKSQKGLGFTKGVEKHSGSAESKSQTLLGRDKVACRAQEEAQKRKPFLPPLDTSISSLSNIKWPDPWVEEDQERSAIDSRAVWLSDEGCSQRASSRSGSGSLTGAGYNYMFSPNLPNTLWGDEPVVSTTTNSSDLWEEIDFREIILQLKD